MLTNNILVLENEGLETVSTTLKYSCTTLLFSIPKHLKLHVRHYFPIGFQYIYILKVNQSEKTKKCMCLKIYCFISAS